MRITYSNPRYEFKYIARRDIAEELVARMADVISEDEERPRYSVTSIYFDSPERQFYYEKLDGADPRVKVRVRWYDQNRTVSFLELKHRKGDRLWKQRTPVHSPNIKYISELTSLPAESGALQRLLNPIENLGLVSQVGIHYDRAVFTSRVNPELRITIDSNLMAFPTLSTTRKDPATYSRFLPDNQCILECKFPVAMPLFLIESIRELGIKVRRYSKYCSGLENVFPNLAERCLVTTPLYD